MFVYNILSHQITTDVSILIYMPYRMGIASQKIKNMKFKPIGFSDCYETSSVWYYIVSFFYHLTNVSYYSVSLDMS